MLFRSSQRLDLTLLHLLNTEPHTNPSQGDAWEGFMKALAFSGDLLTPLTHAVPYPLAEDLYDLSLRGVESLYRGFWEENRQEREEPVVLTMITVLISEGLLAKVLEKTLQLCQEEGSQTNMKAANSCCHSAWKHTQQTQGCVGNSAMSSTWLAEMGPNRSETSS